ncbi:MAG TPA: TonB-dependent receptor [Chitinophagaceae bacterium]|nr:TonB-dependent receptor [Chitinophagaceae bacterium]
MMRKFFKRKVLLTMLGLWHVTYSYAQDAYIKGTVTFGDEYLSNATVSLGEVKSLTNSKGEFLFLVKPGHYRLVITHVGYSKIEETITVQAGESKLLNYKLNPLSQMGEEVVINSLAGVKRSNLATAVPVTAISSKTLLQTGQPSFVQMLDATVPSINISRQQIWDNISIRGLRPDQALITVDGIRYHARSSVSFRGAHGSLGNGAVNNDLYAIPFSAIDKIEILLDGASAQRGSDAIAGVIDLQLKKATGKTSIQVNSGQYYPGDGQNINFGFHHGVLINKKDEVNGRQGYMNFSADFHHRPQTYRGNIYGGTVYYDDNVRPQDKDSIIALDNQKIAERGFDRKWVPRGRESTKLYSLGFLVNGGLPVKNNMEIFWTGIINYRYPSYLSAYRFPKHKQQVNLELYPDGFLPKVITPIWDYSVKAGAKGKTTNNWEWVFVSSLGQNRLTVKAHNSNNASQQFLLGKNAQTSFQCGGTSFSQFLNNINFTKHIPAPNKKIKNIFIASGAEWRLENYRIKAGEEAAWKNYDSTDQKDGGAAALGNFSDSNAVNVDRHIIALYADIETEFNDRLLVDKAIRFESYSGYGSSFAGKLAVRYKFLETFTLRSSISNSFRTPPLQQAYFGTTSAGWRDDNGIRVPASAGVLPNNHPVVSNGFGVPKLKPEKAINISGGITSYISSRFSVTMDAYWIQVKDRIVFSGRFDRRRNPAVNNILQPYPNIEVVTFTCNAVNTRTMGGDIALNSQWNFMEGQLRFTLAANFNRTRVFGVIQSAKNLPDDPVNSNTLFNRGAKGNIEKLQPQSKIIFTTAYRRGAWLFTMINRRFGSTRFIHETIDTLDEFFSAKILTDLNIRFSPKPWYSITIGCNNLFNVKPDPLENYGNTDYGRSIYGSQYLPFNANGGYYFVGVSFYFQAKNKKGHR